MPFNETDVMLNGVKHLHVEHWDAALNAAFEEMLPFVQHDSALHCIPLRAIVSLNSDYEQRGISCIFNHFSRISP